MITNEELLATKEYWTTRIQLDLYSQLQDYMNIIFFFLGQLAQELGVTKSYVTQILNGDFDHRISKLVELSLAVGLIPKMEFVPKTEFFEETNKATTDFQRVSTNSDRTVPSLSRRNQCGRRPPHTTRQNTGDYAQHLCDSSHQSDGL